MLASLEAILPLFLIIGMGFVAKKTVLDVKLLPGLNSFVYFFAVPALLFSSSSRLPIEEILYVPGIMAFLLGIVLTSLVILGGCRFLLGEKQKSVQTLQVMNGVFSNYAYMGIPLSFAVLGDAAYGATISIILIGNIVLIVGGQVVLEALKNSEFNIKSVWGIADRSLLRNPVFLSTMTGLLFSANGWELPSVLNQTLDMLAPAAVPVALFCIGASLTISKGSLNIPQLGWLMLAKLFIHPVLTLVAFYLLGLNGTTWQITAVLLSALPTGALAHVVALKYDVYETQTAQMVVLSTMVSLLTVVGWMSVIN